MLLLQWGAERAESQETMSIGKDSVVDDPSENKVCSLYSGSTALINVHEWASESVANPTVSNRVTISTEWDLFSRMGEYGQTSLSLWQFSICLQHTRGDQSPLKWWGHYELLYGDEATSGRSPTSPTGDERGCKWAVPMAHLWRPQAC